MSSSDEDTNVPTKKVDVSESSDEDEQQQQQKPKEQVQAELDQKKQESEQKKAQAEFSDSEEEEEEKKEENPQDKLKEKGKSAMDLIKQKAEASKERIANLKNELQNNPENKDKIAGDIVSGLKEAANDVKELQEEGKNLKAETIGAVAVGVSGIAEQQQQQKARPKRSSQALKYQLDVKTCNQIRKESYNVLKSQDDKMIEYFEIHRILVEACQARIERRMKISNESMKLIIVYFQNKAAFENHYCKAHQQKLPKLSMLFKDMQDSSTVMYPGLSKGLLECDDMNDQQMKLVQLFANYIEKNIIKDMLSYDCTDFEKKTTLQCEKIKKAKLKAQTCAKEYSKHSQKYQKVYHDLLVTEEKAKKKDKDFYNVECKFKKSSLDYMRAEREYGVELWKLWVEVKKLEIHRLDLIKRAYQMYLEKYKNTYGVMPMMEQQMKSWVDFESEKEGIKNYEMEAILNNEDVSNLRKGTGKEQVDIEDLEYYLTKYQCSELDMYSKLVLQTFSAERDVATMKKSFKSSEIVVTIDDFLLFFDDPKEDEIKGANKKLHMNKISVKKIKNKETELYIVEKVPGMLYNTSNKILVKFENQAQMDEFVDYVAKFTKVGEVDN